MSAFKAVFVDFSAFFHDKHAVYALSARLRQSGIETYHICERSVAKTVARVLAIKPDLLLYSAYSRDIPVFETFDRRVKKDLAVSSIIGGPGPTFDRSFFADSSIDALCIGEGELALVDYIKGGLVPVRNIVTRESGPEPEFAPYADLDAMPFPDREIVYAHDYVLRNNPSKQFLSGRGCPYQCTYCHNHIRNALFKRCGPVVRKKSVAYLIGEIAQVKGRYPLSTVVFNDDTFILNKKWLFEFCEEFPRKIGLPFTCNVRADLVDDEAVAALKAGGCASVYWSIESGNDFIRNTVLKRNMSREQILETARLLRKHGIAFRCGSMLGLPGETRDQMLETLSLNIEVRPDFGFAFIFQPLPGLEITKYALEHGHLDAASLEGLPPHFHKRSVLNFTEKEKDLMQRLCYLFTFCVRIPSMFYRKRLFTALLKLPIAALYIASEIYSGYKMTRVYRVRTNPRLKLAMALRFMTNPY